MRRVLCAALVCAGAAACGPQTPPPTPAQDIPSAAELFNLEIMKTYRCADGASLMIRYKQDPHQAFVSVDGGIPHILQPSMSGAGNSYKAAGVSLENKGYEVVWADFAKPETRCVEAQP